MTSLREKISSMFFSNPYDIKPYSEMLYDDQDLLDRLIDNFPQHDRDFDSYKTKKDNYYLFQYTEEPDAKKRRTKGGGKKERKSRKHRKSRNRKSKSTKNRYRRQYK
jgi:hypothetical protein